MKTLSQHKTLVEPMAIHGLHNERVTLQVSQSMLNRKNDTHSAVFEPDYLTGKAG